MYKLDTSSLRTAYREGVKALRATHFFRAAGLMLVMLYLASLALYLAEMRSGSTQGLWDSIWWALVTVTTVGYGDIVPKTVLGRLIAFVVMASGLFLVSLLTAAIASVFVSRKIKEGKGLAPQVKTCAELRDAENKEHLIRANVDELVVRGEYNAAILAGAAAAACLFQDMDPSELEAVARIMTPVRFGAREVIMKEGEPGHSMYVVAEGEVQVNKALTMKFGKDDFRETEKTLTVLRGADHPVIGEMALEQVSMGLTEFFGGVEEDVARGLSLRMDHGSQYLSDHFLNQIRFWGVAPSFSFVSLPQTNGIVERFFRTLEERAIYGRIFLDVEEVRKAIDIFIKT